jgi:hypothetical protein
MVYMMNRPQLVEKCNLKIIFNDKSHHKFVNFYYVSSKLANHLIKDFPLIPKAQKETPRFETVKV